MRVNLGFWLFTRLVLWATGLAILLAGVLLAGHYFITLQHLPRGLMSPRLFLLLVPRIMTYALPLGLFMAIGIVVDGMVLARESIIISYFSRAQRAWWLSVGCVSVIIGCLFAVCIGWLGPVWYRAAKQEIVTNAARLVRALPAQEMMRVSPQLSVWYGYRVKMMDSSVPFRLASWDPFEWCDARLYLTDKQDRIVISAKRAQLGTEAFNLYDGSIAHWAKDGVSHHQFGSLQLPYGGKLGIKAFPPKHMTAAELWLAGIWRELVHRGVQVVLLFLLAWAMLVGMTLVPMRGRSRLVMIIGLAVMLLAVMQTVSVLV